jgi:aspartokinase/homoserine dehydrogenase 1
MKKTNWIVHKFGGTSVGSVDAFRKVKSILANMQDSHIAVVVSAMSGVTDKLIKTAMLASQQNSEYEKILTDLESQHAKAAVELLPAESAQEYTLILKNDVKDLREILRGVWLSRNLPESTLEMVSGYGELWSSLMLAAICGKASLASSTNSSSLTCPANKKVSWVDARKILVVESGDTGPQLDWPICQSNMDQFLNETQSSFLVITGFIASTKTGVPTTLKRNGSDFSASIFGRLLQSREIVIWTDVDGVYSADPRKVPDAELLNEISYEEAIELAYFGAKVIHPHTMGPAVSLGIPILIKNTFNPSAPGTYIHKVEKHHDNRVARGFTTVDQLSLINVEGTGMIGVPGVAQRLFGALREVGVSVILISQASSEHSICIAVPSAQAEKAKHALEKSFFAEIKYGQIEKVHVINECSIIAMVGDNMVEKPGVAGKFFAALAAARINIRAVAQGSSERNISAVIDQKDSVRALRATHSAFYLSEHTISLGIVGLGQIGKTFLNQIYERKNLLKEKFNLDIRVRGVCNSKNMLLSEKGFLLGDNINLAESGGRVDLAESNRKVDLVEFVNQIKSENIPHSVIIDCSASDEMANHYETWLKNGLHVITPNKKAGSGDWHRYQKIKEASQLFERNFLYEATVGAGLPVLSTLIDLIQTGDEIIKIEGILSGTLSFIFTEFAKGTKFSQVVAQAKLKGYTEPDPRDDLNGLDFARKMVILARDSGFSINLSDIKIESLVPAELKETKNVDEFMTALAKYDDAMEQRKNEVKGSTLRYMGSYNAKTNQVDVGLKAIPLDHPFARLQGSDNIIAFTTKRYQNPLIVQGPGAGPEVTAGGIFADLLRLARNLGAKT